MKKTFFTRFSAIIVVVFLAFAAVTANAAQYAILVGVSEYLEGGTLPSAPNDAKALRDVLLHIGYPPENVICLTSGSDVHTLPIKSTIEKKIEEVLKKARPGDTVIICMSGHGMEVDGKPQFCPVDMRSSDLMATTVSLNAILESFESCKAEHKLMIIDACRNDPTKEIEGNAVPLKPLVTPTKGVMLFQSCSVGQTSVE